MNTEARDKALIEILQPMADEEIDYRSALKAIKLAYEAGYAEQPRDAVSDEYDKGFTDGMREGRRAARDEAIRILSARKDNDYESE